MSFGSERESESIILRRETIELFRVIQNFSKEKISQIFKVKGKLLEDTLTMYKSNFTEKQTGNAIESYTGVVFEQLNLSSYSSSQIEYMSSNVRILSAMYGVLAPYDMIYPYRLDMTIKLPKMNLYRYWQKTIDDYFYNENLVINLASNEFSKLLKNYSGRMINIEFYEETEDNLLRVVSYNAKKCRGKMLNFLIENHIDEIDLIKDFNFDNYVYSEKHSKLNKLIFIKHI